MIKERTNPSANENPKFGAIRNIRAKEEEEAVGVVGVVEVEVKGVPIQLSPGKRKRLAIPLN